MGGPIEIKGPDLAKGVPLAGLGDGMTLLGHVGDEPVLVVRRGGELLAIGAICTHYDSQLADGIIVGDTVHCPTHHACFDLRTGEATAPAFKPVASWNVEQRGESFFVTSKRPAVKRASACRSSVAEKCRDCWRWSGGACFSGVSAFGRLHRRNHDDFSGHVSTL
jgi:Ferredoxin subunits of nitrite reductase and ring-hydroxylating dioxygenases